MKRWALIIEYEYGCMASLHLSEADADAAEMDYCKAGWCDACGVESMPDNDADIIERYYESSQHGERSWLEVVDVPQGEFIE